MKSLELTAVMREKLMGRNYKHVPEVKPPGAAPARVNSLWSLPNLSAADIGAICQREGSDVAARLPSRGPFSVLVAKD